MTQSELANLTGTQQKTITAIENGSEGTKLDTLLRIIASLGLDMLIVPREQGRKIDRECLLAVARKMTHQPLYVLINGRFVGRLEKASTGAISFQYGDAWLASEHRFAVSLGAWARKEQTSTVCSKPSAATVSARRSFCPRLWLDRPRARLQTSLSMWPRSRQSSQI